MDLYFIKLENPRQMVRFVFALIASPLLLFAVKSFLFAIRLKKFGRKTNAKVIGFKERGKDKYQVKHWALLLEVQDRGKTWQFVSELHWASPPYVIGNEVPILYLDSQKETPVSRLDDWEELLMNTFFLGAIALALLFVVLVTSGEE